MRQDTSKAEAMLQWRPRLEEESIRDCGQSLIDRRLVAPRSAIWNWRIIKPSTNHARTNAS